MFIYKISSVEINGCKLNIMLDSLEATLYTIFMVTNKATHVCRVLYCV